MIIVLSVRQSDSSYRGRQEKGEPGMTLKVSKLMPATD